MVDEMPRRAAAIALLRAHEHVSHAFQNPDGYPTSWREQLHTVAAKLAGVAALQDALDLAVFRTVYLTAHDMAIEDTISQAESLDRSLPGAGVLLCMVSLDGSAAVGAWDDFDGYETESREVVAKRHFRNRWIRRATGERHWTGFTEAALGMLSLPPCEWSLDVFGDDEAVVDFWLHGDHLKVFGNPDPYWRGAGK